MAVGAVKRDASHRSAFGGQRDPEHYFLLPAVSNGISRKSASLCRRIEGIGQTRSMVEAKCSVDAGTGRMTNKAAVVLATKQWRLSMRDSLKRSAVRPRAKAATGPWDNALVKTIVGAMPISGVPFLL